MAKICPPPDCVRNYEYSYLRSLNWTFPPLPGRDAQITRSERNDRHSKVMARHAKHPAPIRRVHTPGIPAD